MKFLLSLCLFCLFVFSASSAAVRADTFEIFSGTLDFGGGNYRLEGVSTIIEGRTRNVFDCQGQCSAPRGSSGAAPGSLFSFSSTYNNINPDRFNPEISVTGVFGGVPGPTRELDVTAFLTFTAPSFLLPAERLTSFTVSTPFSFVGDVRVGGPTNRIALFGTGTATGTFVLSPILTTPPTDFFNYRLVGLTYTFTPTTPTPEPMTLLLLGTGLAGVAARAKRRRVRGSV